MLTKMDIKTELEKIYTACNDKRVFEIQNMIGELLKKIGNLKLFRSEEVNEKEEAACDLRRKYGNE